jgi:hypothetical protein
MASDSCADRVDPPDAHLQLELDAHLQLEYEQVNDNFRMLADIRFKLLALVPTIGGVAIYILGNMGDPAKTVTPFDYARILLIAIMGFLATLGVVFYDQRNSEFYNALDGRARKLERDLQLPCGQFNTRPGRGHGRLLFNRVVLGHDTGLALIYGTVLGGWFFPITFSALSLTGRIEDWASYSVALGVAVVLIVVFILELIRMDGWEKKIWKRPAQRANSAGGKQTPAAR